MTTPKISLLRLRQLIKDEVAQGNVSEGVDHKGITSITSTAGKLMAAIEGFKEKAPPAAINAVTPCLGQLEEILENMLSSPGSYVVKPKKEPQHVTLKATKS